MIFRERHIKLYIFFVIINLIISTLLVYIFSYPIKFLPMIFSSLVGSIFWVFIPLWWPIKLYSIIILIFLVIIYFTLKILSKLFNKNWLYYLIIGFILFIYSLLWLFYFEATLWM